MVVLSGMISVQNVSKSFGERAVLERASMEIPEGCICGIYGKSGIGKSTMAKLLCGVIRPREGEIRLDDRLLVPGSSPMTENWG